MEAEVRAVVFGAAVEAVGAVVAAGVATGAAAGVGAGVDAFGAAAAGAESAAYQVSTPWCPRQAPCFFGAVVKVPSLHFPVAPAGIAPLAAEAVAAVLGVDAAEADEDAALEEALGAALAAAYQLSTPLCPLHAPCFVGVEVKVPSLHLPVVPAGAPAGAWARRMHGERRSPTTTPCRILAFIFTVLWKWA